MATRFELVLIHPDRALARAAGECALEEIVEADRRLSRFRRDSWTSHLVRNAPHGPVRVDAELFRLLSDCEAVRGASRGAFDITRGTSRSLLLDESKRTVEMVAASGGAPPALDFGAVGKGYALDRAAEVLVEHGVTSGLLHGGTSTVLALEAPVRPVKPAQSGGWGVSIAGVGGLRVELVNQALSVSSQAEREHITDPRSGTPSAGDSPVAVTAASATLADAWSTALLVLGDVSMTGPFHRLC